jgi:hypothetical protein
MSKVLAAFAVSVLIVGPLAADCDDDPENLLAGINCAFDLGITGWTALDGQLYHDSGDGHPSAGSAYAYADAPTEWFAMLNDACILIPPSESYWFGAWATLEPTSDASTRCEVRFQVYDNDGCTGSTLSIPSTSWVGTQTGYWVLIDGDFTAGLLPQWAQLYALCMADSSPFAVLIDDFFLKEDPRIFTDGFEDGDCFNWSVCPMGGPV